MNKIRIIPRIDIKNQKLVKTVHLEGVMPIGDPIKKTLNYYNEGADEILFVDVVASLYERNSLTKIIEEIAKNIFIPLTVAGGIRSLKDVETALKSGADKVAINTAACLNPSIINEISKNFGSQCMVSQIDAKKIDNNKWEPYINGGRDRTNKNLEDWLTEVQDRGAGEILLTSIDHEGTGFGFDLNLLNKLKLCYVPCIYSGGIGNLAQLKIFIKNEINLNGLAFSKLLHLENTKINDIKKFLKIK